MSYKEDREFADELNQSIICLLERVLGGKALVASDEQDMKQATDFIANGYKVGCRIRRFSEWGKYPRHEFTIRCGRPGKNDTELAKILDGHGDFLLYGFSDESGSMVHKWMLIDLDAFRKSFNPQADLDRKRNQDGSSDLAVFHPRTNIAFDVIWATNINDYPMFSRFGSRVP